MRSYAMIVTALCDSEGWPRPEPEARFHPTRKWRIDLLWREQRLACEVDGGVFLAGGGRHTRGAGWLKDAEKLNALALAGYRLIRVTPRQVTDGTLLQLLQQVFREAA